MKKNILILCLISFCGLAFGAEFESAEITKVQNQVEVFDLGQTPDLKPEPAKPDQIISGRNAVRTGTQSRAELKFNDSTLARLGGNTLFCFKQNQREALLRTGTLLFQVPKNAGGMQVTTAAVTAAITGTTGFIQTNSTGVFKTILMEGSAKVYLNGNPNDFIQLGAGDMISVPAGASKLPKPVRVDIQKLLKTSGLIQGMAGGLNLNFIQQAINRQQKRMEEENLQSVSLDDFPAAEAGELMNTLQNSVESTPPPSSSHSRTQGGGSGSYSVGGS